MKVLPSHALIHVIIKAINYAQLGGVEAGGSVKLNNLAMLS
jgi:hypothetical protein